MVIANLSSPRIKLLLLFLNCIASTVFRRQRVNSEKNKLFVNLYALMICQLTLQNVAVSFECIISVTGGRQHMQTTQRTRHVYFRPSVPFKALIKFPFTLFTPSPSLFFLTQPPVSFPSPTSLHFTFNPDNHFSSPVCYTRPSVFLRQVDSQPEDVSQNVDHRHMLLLLLLLFCKMLTEANGRSIYQIKSNCSRQIVLTLATKHLQAEYESHTIS